MDYFYHLHFCLVWKFAFQEYMRMVRNYQVLIRAIPFEILRGGGNFHTHFYFLSPIIFCGHHSHFIQGVYVISDVKLSRSQFVAILKAIIV